MRYKKYGIVMKTTAVSLCAALAFGNTMPVMAADTDYLKDENVYVTLEQDGSVSDVYVVNEFTSGEAGKIVDYGNYKEIKNLTSDAEITQSGNKVTFDVPKGKFYYQGNIDTKDLPWNVDITYSLDGKETDAQDLAGKSGHLVIRIHTTENKNCDTSFFENYLLQATVVLDTEKCSRIQAEGATAGNVGRTRQLLYNIMAGQEKDIEIEADVEDFEMEGITFKGVPMAFDINEDFVDTEELHDQIKEVRDAATTLNTGAGALSGGTASALAGSVKLQSGAAQLHSGVGSLLTGQNTLQTASQKLVSGTGSLTTGLGTLQTQVNAFAGSVKQMDPETISANLTAVNNSLKSLSVQAASLSRLLSLSAQTAQQLAEQFTTALQGVNTQVLAANHAIAEKDQALAAGAQSANGSIEQAIAAIDASVAAGAIDTATADGLKADLEASKVDVVQVSGLAEITMPGNSKTTGQAIGLLTTAADKLSEAATGFQNASTELAKAAGGIQVPSNLNQTIAQLQTAVDQAYKASSQLNAGMKQLNSGIGSSVLGTKSLQNGTTALLTGTTQLSEGLKTLNAGSKALQDGTQQFAEEASGADDKVEDEMQEVLDKIAGTDYEPVSFVDPENKEIGLVQFVLRTDAIEKEDAEETVEQQQPETIWEKFKSLF